MKRKIYGKRKKRLAWAGVSLLLAIFAAGGVYLWFRARDSRRDAVAPAMQVNASLGTLSTTIVGSGQLQSAKAQEIQVPVGLTIESIAVEAGDTVSVGDMLATVDETALTAQIAQMQSVIAELDEQVQECDGEDQSQYVTSKVAGRVKKIYVETGDSVADAMVAEGALLLLSLDGKMAVQMETGAELETGSAVMVACSDGTNVSGTVKTCSGGKVTVTLTDDGTALGDTVTVLDDSGDTVGEGTLYVHQPLEITATAGEVAAIHVAENQWVEAKGNLITLTDAPVSSQRQELLAVRTVYKEKLQELLAMADDYAITAPLDGVIESVELSPGSVTAASSSSGGSQEDASTAGIPATGMAMSGTVRAACAVNFQKLTADISFNQNGVQEYTDGGGASRQAYTEEQVNAQYEIREDSGQSSGSQPDTGQQNMIQQNTVQENSQELEAQQSALATTGDSETDASVDSYSVPDIQGLRDQVTGFTIAVQDSMILSVEIDELDILSVKEGQSVQIAMDAAEGKEFTGEVTQVSDSASGSDGSAKYTVEVTLPREAFMRVGMSASATIVTEEKENVVTVLAEAVQERGPQTFVYTQYDETSDTLSGEVQVETGLSDGEKVEIVSGLAEGDAIYYKKTESQPQESDQGNRRDDLFSPDGNRGKMPDGAMPQGAPGGPGGGQ
ncbi:MAG: HlyD family efflux transporter periplasmic adaptor subunit [Lachnospiraceae bacterium]|nr:HlyD family efflux transporter periplasmic adaptor subunit [Lachnospiraceae bacterium]